MTNSLEQPIEEIANKAMDDLYAHRDEILTTITAEEYAELKARADALDRLERFILKTFEEYPLDDGVAIRSRGNNKFAIYGHDSGFGRTFIEAISDLPVEAKN